MKYITGRHCSMPDSMQNARQNVRIQRSHTDSGLKLASTDAVIGQEHTATLTLAQNGNPDHSAPIMSFSLPNQSFVSSGSHFRRSCDTISESPPVSQQQPNDVTLPTAQQGLHYSSHSSGIPRLASDGNIRSSPDAGRSGHPRQNSLPATIPAGHYPHKYHILPVSQYTVTNHPQVLESQVDDNDVMLPQTGPRVAMPG